MKTTVLKFGGSSLSSDNGLLTVSKIVRDCVRQNTAIIVVVSAFEGCTNQLLLMSREAERGEQRYAQTFEEFRDHHLKVIKRHITGDALTELLTGLVPLFSDLQQLLHGVFLLRDLSSKTQDLILSFGERLSALIVTEYLKQEQHQAQAFDSRELFITDRNFGTAAVKLEITTKRIRKSLGSFKGVPVVTGFLGSTAEGESTTLGRGGSDYTAAIIGAALGAEEIQLWTDVDGVMTADPRKVNKAFTIPHLSYEEAMELCHFGARVIFPPTMQPALDAKIPIRIKNTLAPDSPGSLISSAPPQKQNVVTGISSIAEVSLLRLQGSGMMGIAGVAKRLFDSLSRERIRVILISQASSEHTICFAIEPAATRAAKRAIEEEFALEMQTHKIENVLVEDNLSIVAVVGANMHNTPGISGKVFQAMGKNGINIRAIAQGSSELNISLVIQKSDEAKALNALHDSFFLSNIKTIHLFLVGTRNVGGKLLEQIAQNNESFRQRMLEIKVVGLANSRKMLIEQNGINLNRWRSLLDESKQASDIKSFSKQMNLINLPNSIFVDCTASSEVADSYLDILSASISVITPNKRANSGSHQSYLELKDKAAKANVKFFYETNVGAGLPVINTLNDLLASGDEIIRIEAVLSGTLSYIFNSYTLGKTFSQVVRDAKNKGLTEPDPRDDLSGTDVARKLLILGREIGMPLELPDINVQSLVPESCLEANGIEDFFDKLKTHDEVYGKQLEQAATAGKVLRYIAIVEKGRAEVSLHAVDASHPFFGLSGSDNIISFTTKRYLERPLVVKGPGAGNDVTAAGVLADIMRAASYLS